MELQSSYSSLAGCVSSLEVVLHGLLFKKMNLIYDFLHVDGGKLQSKYKDNNLVVLFEIGIVILVLFNSAFCLQYLRFKLITDLFIIFMPSKKAVNSFFVKTLQTE